MRRMRIWITWSCCILAFQVFAGAQTKRTGLWEVTITMAWQQSPFPPGTDGGTSPFAGGTQTTLACLTQKQLDKFGGPPPRTRGDCQVANVVKQSGTITADLVCKGTMSGTGTFTSSWTDDKHTASSVQFTGSLQLGGESKPVEWTTDSTSVFKSADCGDVKPNPLASQ